MANWVEGKLKIRGKPEDIKRWVEECLHCYTTNWLGDGAHTELVEGAVRFEHDPDSEEMYLYVDKSAHIEGTRRNFIEKGEYVDFCEEGKKSILVVNMKAAWNIEEQPYILKCPKSTTWILECTAMKWAWSSTRKSRS